MNTRTTVHRSRMSKRGLNSVCVLLVGVCAHTASAQIDYRIDYRQSANGRMYDANNRIGSGGVNPRAQISNPYAYNYDSYANQIVTGNVTGLAGFKGLSVIPGVNQFRGGLQSDALAQFRARSVNFEQVRSGSTIGGGGYYDPSTSIADLGVIRYGLNQPGSSFLSSPQVQLPSPNNVASIRDRLLGIDKTDAYRGPIGLTDPPTDLGRTVQRPIVADARNHVEFSDSYPRNPYQSAMQSTLFGSPQYQAETDTPLSVPQVNFDQPVDGRFSTALTRDELLGIAERAGAEGMDGSDFQASGRGGLTTNDDALINGLGRSDRVVFSLDEGDGDSQDELFNRMIEATQQFEPKNPLEGFLARQARSDSPALDPVPDPALDGSIPTDETTPSQSISDTQAGVSATADELEIPEISEVDPKTRWATLFVDTPIRSFSMGGSAPIGEYMRSAEAALKKGEFSRAVRLFDLASTVEPLNPLPHLGRGHAHIAAGQYFSAAVALQTGIGLFPQIAAFELDLPALTGQNDVFDRRRADLESMLELNERYELRFLLGYLELYSGFQFDGLNDLRTAAKNAPADSIISSFPDLLLGRKRLESPSSAQ